jgi:hypothetical protein
MPGLNRFNVNVRVCAWLLALLVCLVILVKPAAPQTRRASSPKEILALGIFHFNNDDISGLAEDSFKQLLTPRYVGTEEAESAQYFLASYYERKFYIQRAKWRKDDWASLKQAAAEYRRYTDQYYNSGKSKWLSDAFFNLAIVYMQLNDRQNAVNELSKVKSAASRDPVIYIYQIIWSPQSKDVIDGNLSAARVADITLSLTMKYPYFEQRLLPLTQWCQGEKSK